MTAADDDGERLRRVRLANIRQELLAPASALVGYGEMLHEGAAAGLHHLVHRFRETDHLSGIPSGLPDVVE